jgi:acrylyl-CoA reductase (NADPH)
MTRALQVRRAADADGGSSARVAFVELDDSELGEGEVIVDIEWSSLNYKDALALRGDPGVARINPLVPGIDLAGVVADSGDPRWSAGDLVVLNGFGLGETRNGGYAGRMRVPADPLVRVPEVFGTRRAAAIGTAGFTAALAVLELERHGLPDGEVLVTGATGGVGSIAIALLAASGRRVVASTGSADAAAYLVELGASEVVERRDFQQQGRPLQSSRWAGAVDSLGGRTLANVLAQTRYGGAVASCGLVESDELPGSVMPFILRAVSLLGINSVTPSHERRVDGWARLERALDLELLDRLTTEVPLSEVQEAATRMLRGDLRGRTVVAVER